ncbi:MAG: hypothetical protein ACT4PW_07060 [Acidimicrobiia bacterium]
MTASPRVTRQDLEDKFRELRGEVDTVKESARSYALVAGAIAAAVVIVVVFGLGKRRGKKRSTVVEIRRI